jgi:ribonuclease P protein component
MRRQLRLRRRAEFDAVFERRRTWANNLLVLRNSPNQMEHNRYGFVTSKRLGGAVIRNRVRRRLREVVRTLPVSGGWDVVISAKVPAARSNFQELKGAVVDLLTSARMLGPDKPPEEAQS